MGRFLIFSYIVCFGMAVLSLITERFVRFRRKPAAVTSNFPRVMEREKVSLFPAPGLRPFLVVYFQPARAWLDAFEEVGLSIHCDLAEDLLQTSAPGRRCDAYILSPTYEIYSAENRFPALPNHRPGKPKSRVQSVSATSKAKPKSPAC